MNEWFLTAHRHQKGPYRVKNTIKINQNNPKNSLSHFVSFNGFIILETQAEIRVTIHMQALNPINCFAWQGSKLELLFIYAKNSIQNYAFNYNLYRTHQRHIFRTIIYTFV